MKAKIRTDACGNLTVYLDGALNHENCLPLQRNLEMLIVKNPACNIIIDMYKLDFVGSSGINVLVETIKNLRSQTSRVKVSNIKSEFLRVFRLYDLELAKELSEELNEEMQAPAQVSKWHKAA